jgi:hypothetical protein
MQCWEITGYDTSGSPKYQWFDWARGVTQTLAGDLRMVTEWTNFPFIVRNALQPSAAPTTVPLDNKYIGVERTRTRRGGDS